MKLVIYPNIINNLSMLLFSVVNGKSVTLVNSVKDI